MIEIIKKVAKLLTEKNLKESKEKQEGDVYLFIVGVDKYENSPDLEFCKYDSAFIKNLIHTKSKRNIKEKNVFELYDYHATKVNILNQLSSLNEIVSRKDILIVLFSGYSVMYNKSNFFVPYDGDKENLFSNISSAYFKDFFQRSKSDNSILILNSFYLSASKTDKIRDINYQESENSTYIDLSKDYKSLYDGLVAFLSSKREGLDRSIWHFTKSINQSLNKDDEFEIISDESDLRNVVLEEHMNLYKLIENNEIEKAITKLLRITHNNDPKTRDQLFSLKYFQDNLKKSRIYFDKPVTREEGNVLCRQLIGNVYNQGYYVVPVESTFQSQDEKKKGTKKILFTSADTIDQSRLRLDEEYNAINLSLLRSKFRDEFELVACLSSRIEDLQRNLLEKRPYIVHFSGHGNSSGICLVADASGVTKLVESKPLSGLFKLFSGSLECVFLNSCHSKGQSNEISKFIKKVICMNNRVNDETAIKFASSFYAAMGNGENIDFSFEFAKNSIELHGLSGVDIPELLSLSENTQNNV